MKAECKYASYYYNYYYYYYNYYYYYFLFLEKMPCQSLLRSCNTRRYAMFFLYSFFNYFIAIQLLFTYNASQAKDNSAKGMQICMQLIKIPLLWLSRLLFKYAVGLGHPNEEIRFIFWNNVLYLR